MSIQKSKKKLLKTIMQNLALVGTSTILFIVALEVILRLFGYGNLIIYQPDPNLTWKPIPNQDCYTKIDHKPIHINDEGTRGKHFSRNKGTKTFRILSLGDSRAFGWGLSEPETYSGLLEKRLQEYIGDSLNVEVINAGVNAWSFGQMYVYLRDVGLSYDPDIVILGDANLWTQFSEESSKEFTEKMMNRVWLKNLLRRSAAYHFVIEVKLKKYYEKYRTKFIPVDPNKDEYFKEQQIRNPMLLFKKQIKKICELTKRQNIKTILLNISEEDMISSEKKSDICIVKEEISKEDSLSFIDISEYFSKIKTPLFLADDPVHPNAEGNKIIADKLFELITSESKI